MPINPEVPTSHLKKIKRANPLKQNHPTPVRKANRHPKLNPTEIQLDSCLVEGVGEFHPKCLLGEPWRISDYQGSARGRARADTAMFEELPDPSFSLL